MFKLSFRIAILVAVVLLSFTNASAETSRGTPGPRQTAASATQTGKAHAPNAQTVKASYYGKKFGGKKTANGERFDKNANTAAHKTLPLGSKVEVKNPKTGQQTEVTITDRGPYAKNRQLDLSEKAAKDIGLDKKGTGNVEMTVVERGDKNK